jgi:hypothetical protein
MQRPCVRLAWAAPPVPSHGKIAYRSTAQGVHTSGWMKWLRAAGVPVLVPGLKKTHNTPRAVKVKVRGYGSMQRLL